LPEPIGEAWLTGSECRFADGLFAGKMLGEVWPRISNDWAGSARRDRPFPVLVKFLFPEDKLSVQVHPDDDYAKRHEAVAGGIGKTEMWYVISARPGAEVRVGLKPHVTREIFRSAIAAGNAEEMLERIAVRAGDAIFIPAGTVHTIGPGMVLCEVQQNSDLTYRVYDFKRRDAAGRPRELHLEKAFEVIRFGKQCGGRASQSQNDAGGILLAECDYFRVTKHLIRDSCAFRAGGQMQIAVIVQGSGAIRLGSEQKRLDYAPAQAWLIPAALEEYCLEPRDATTALFISVPSAN